MFVILLSFIPLFSPIAWKYYFMFLTPLLVVLYPLTVKTKLFGWYLIPSLCIALSSEFFLGSYFSDVTEAFGVITLSSLAISFLGLKVFTMQSSKVA
jgi:hypothetical protein